jgi:hypothetical protein
MNPLRQAAQQALEALEKTHTQPGCDQWQAERKASVALRAALERQEQEQEPVAWRYRNANTDHVYLVWKKGTGGRNWTPLYAHPPRREWRSLSEEEILPLYNTTPSSHAEMLEFARAIETKLKEKNQ